MMKTFLRFALLATVVLLTGIFDAHGQSFAPRVHKIIIRHIGPPAVSDEFIRANIRTKEGEPFARPTVDEDLKKLNKKITSKSGQPLDERKLFEDAQEMQKVYEKAGYQKTTVIVQPPVI